MARFTKLAMWFGLHLAQCIIPIQKMAVQSPYFRKYEKTAPMSDGSKQCFNLLNLGVAKFFDQILHNRRAYNLTKRFCPV
jgi:hypothetical protein